MKCNKLVDAGRRQFLRGGMMATAGAVAATVMTPEQAKAQALARVDYPANRLANIADLVVNEPMDISYPDADSPGVLLKLGQAVEGGVGPDGDIVAFSVLCPHKGWLMSYSAEDMTLNGSGQNMGVVVGDLACAKVSSLYGGLPWTYGLQSKLPSTTGRSALISLTAFLDHTG